MFGGRVFVALGLAGATSLSGVLLGTLPETVRAARATDVAEELICRGPFRYSTLVQDAAADGSVEYRLRVRFKKAAGPAADGQGLEAGACAWRDRGMATPAGKAEAELVTRLPVTGVSVVYHLDETSRVTVARVAHPYEDMLSHAGPIALTMSEARSGGGAVYEFTDDVELR